MTFSFLLAHVCDLLVLVFLGSFVDTEVTVFCFYHMLIFTQVIKYN